MVGLAGTAATAAHGWRAALELQFETRGARTVLSARRHEGPLRVQRPFYPDGDAGCHVYLLHPPGGVVGGDELDISVVARPAARCLLTTPAAGKFYRSAGAQAVQSQRLAADCGAILEWLPQENILFGQARVRLATRVELATDATFAGWEIVCLGRAAAGEHFGDGALDSRLQVWRDGRPLLIERLLLGAERETLRAPWGLADRHVTGTFVVSGDYAAQRDALRAALPAQAPSGAFALTQLPGILVCRYLGNDSEEARRGFETAWQLLRPVYAGVAAIRPRIWDT